MQFDFTNNQFTTTSTNVQLISPQAAIYRDKLLPDDLSIKPLYNKVLRELPWQIKIADFKITDGELSYTENIDAAEKSGNIFFTQMEIAIKDLSNFKNTEKTSIHAQAKVMDQAQLTLDWELAVQDVSDAFTVSGNVKNFDTSLLNSFLKPSLGVRAEGFVEQMYFTFSGNNKESSGDMMMKYQDFEFKV